MVTFDNAVLDRFWTAVSNAADNQAFQLGEDNAPEKAKHEAGALSRTFKAGDNARLSITENNRVRQTLLDAVKLVCNDTKTFGSLPDSVRAAFKGTHAFSESGDLDLDAQGRVTSGKPLTARRIRKVLTAVHEHISRTKAGVGGPQSGVGIPKPDVSGVVKAFMELQPKLLPGGSQAKPLDGEMMKAMALSVNVRNQVAQNVGEALADQAEMVGQAMLIAENLPELQSMVANPEKKASHMVDFLYEAAHAKCHPENMDSGNAKASDAEYKSYIARCASDYVNMLINNLATIAGQEDQNLRNEAVRRLFAANDGTCLEARIGNVQREASVSSEISDKPLAYEFGQIYDEVFNKSGVHRLREALIDIEAYPYQHNGGITDEQMTAIKKDYGDMSPETIFEKFSEKLAKLGNKDTSLPEGCKKLVNDAWNSFKDDFKNHLMEKFAGQQRQAFELTKNKDDQTWTVRLLVAPDENVEAGKTYSGKNMPPLQTLKPILKRFTDADIAQMGDLFFDYGKDSPWILTFPELEVVGMTDERSPQAGYNYFNEMRELAQKTLGDDDEKSLESNESFKDLVATVGRELERNNMKLSDSDLQRQVETTLRELRGWKNEELYDKRLSPFMDDQFADLLTNKERLAKLVENMIFTGKNTFRITYPTDKPDTCPATPLLVRNLKPSAIKVARALRELIPKKYQDVGIETLANRIANGFVTVCKDIKPNTVYEFDKLPKGSLLKGVPLFLDKFGRIKVEPKLEHVITTKEQNRLYKLDEFIQRCGNTFNDSDPFPPKTETTPSETSS